MTMENIMEIYNLEITDDLLDGIYAVAIVDHPATEQAYMLFSKQTEHKFRVEDEEKQIITGAILVADTPIYRNNEALGEHYVQFTKDMVRKAMQLFFKNSYHLNANFQHDDSKKLNDVYFYESFQVDQERGISAPKGIDVPDGSWVGTMKVEDDKLWEEIKSGNFTGFSIEGLFRYVKLEENPVNDEELLEAVKELLDQLEEQL